MPAVPVPSDHGVDMTGSPEPLQVLRSRRYLGLLLLAALIGVPIAAAAYGFLALVQWLQTLLYTDLPRAIGLAGEPLWWPLPLLCAGGLLVGLSIRFLPGTGGHSPADGLHPGAPPPIELPGVLAAALASLALGAVIGPEAPLIALGGGLAAAVPLLASRTAVPRTTAVVGGAGSFAAVSTLLGSPILGAFLLMEAAGLGGAMLDVVLVPGLLAAGIGALIFLGLDAWSGLGTFSLAIPGLPPAGQLDIAEFGWALAIGVAAALLGTAIRRLAVVVRARVERRLVLLTPLAGLVIAGLAIAYAAATGRSSSEVLFSGQAGLGPLLAGAAGYSVATLMLLMVCKGLAYAVALSSFRGGPVFPALFLGAAGGIALSHLPGMALVPAVGMGMGAMSAVMLRLPLTSVLLATVLLLADGIAIMPVVIVAVVVAYVASARLGPAPSRAPADRASEPVPASDVATS
jgi:chloride channel protein, CIC family